MKSAPPETILPKILIYDDDRDMLDYVSSIARRFGFETVAVSNFSEFEKEYTKDINIIIIDLLMPDKDGVEILRYLSHLNCESGIVLSSAERQTVLKAAARLAQAYKLRYMGTLAKPYSVDAIETLLASAIPEIVSQRKRVFPTFGMKDIRRCIAKDEIVVFFQPKIDVGSLEFVSVEALVRWQHPDLGILGPGAFLPQIEQHDMIGTLTTLIMEKAYAQINAWDSIGLSPNLAVNLSARSFNDLYLPEQFVSIAKKYHVPIERITLEVTESWMTQDTVAALDILTRLRLKGFNLSIDDFGTGYSTMLQLKQIPFTELKLDQSFVRGAANDEDSRAIVEACIGLGRTLGLHVVAEGVEKQSDWDLVTELGCDECQGYFVARPMPGDNVPTWLERWNRSLGAGA